MNVLPTFKQNIYHLGQNAYTPGYLAHAESRNVIYVRYTPLLTSIEQYVKCPRPIQICVSKLSGLSLIDHHVEDIFRLLLLHKMCSFYPLTFGPKGILAACVRPSVRPSVNFIRTITRHRYELESLSLYQTCIVRYSWLVLNMDVIDPDLQDHFGHFDSEF